MQRTVATVAVAVFVAVGCASTPEDIGPDLGPSKEHVEQRIRSLDAAEQAVNSDLERLEDRRDELTALAERVDGDELPLSLLRLVAMNCINAAYDSGPGDGIELGGMTLSCDPAHYDRLEAQLQQLPVVTRDEAFELLYAADRARLLRGSLRRRLAALPQSVNEHHQFLADERAMLRQLESDLEQERNVYSAGEWQQVTDRVDAYRELLAQLDERIDQLVDDYPQWPDRVDELVTEIYFELADLRS